MTTKQLLNGKVRWFDSLKNEGVIRDINSGESFYINGSDIKSGCVLNKNDIVRFSLHVDYKWIQVDYCEVVEVSNVF